MKVGVVYLTLDIGSVRWGNLCWGTVVRLMGVCAILCDGGTAQRQNSKRLGSDVGTEAVEEKKVLQHTRCQVAVYIPARERSTVLMGRRLAMRLVNR